MNDDKQELLEIYKLHSELADRVSQRREGANRIYVSLLTGILVFLAAFIRFGAGSIPVSAIATAGGILGIALSMSWYVVIRSYRQLNTGKFDTLLELEKKLSYSFFDREWFLLREDKNTKPYWRLTVVETSLPIIFSVFFILLIFAPMMEWL